MVTLRTACGNLRNRSACHGVYLFIDFVRCSQSVAIVYKQHGQSGYSIDDAICRWVRTGFCRPRNSVFWRLVKWRHAESSLTDCSVNPQHNLQLLWPLLFLGAFAKLRKVTFSFIMSVCPSVPTGRILMKLHIWVFSNAPVLLDLWLQLRNCAALHMHSAVTHCFLVLQRSNLWE